MVILLSYCYNAFSSEVSGALLATRHNQGDRVIRTPGRTHNRIRSPRLIASGEQNNVGKGSRQERSLISGKGLALGIGCGGRCLKFESYRSYSTFAVGNGFDYYKNAGQVVASGLPLCGEQATQNWNGHWESDCLIKTKHCDNSEWIFIRCKFCPVL